MIAQKKNGHICEFIPQQRIKHSPVFTLALQGWLGRRYYQGFKLQMQAWRHKSDVKRGVHLEPSIWVPATMLK